MIAGGKLNQAENNIGVLEERKMRAATVMDGESVSRRNRLEEADTCGNWYGN